MTLIVLFVFFDRQWQHVTKLLSDKIANQIHASLHLLDHEAPPLSQALIYNYFKLRVHSSPPASHLAFQGWSDDLAKSILKQSLDEELKRPSEIFFLKDTIFVKLQRHTQHVYFEFPRKHLLSKTTYVFIMWMLGLPFLLFLIAWLFMKNQIRPLHKLAAAADRFGKGKSINSFKPEGSFEVRQAGVAFNIMRERLQRQIHQRLKMLAGISHDLRTPLTRLKLQLSIMQKEGHATYNMDADIEEMKTMIEGYLTFAQGNQYEETRDIYIDRLFSDLENKYSSSKVVICPADHVLIETRIHSLKRAMQNIIDNGLKYATHVWLQCDMKGDELFFIFDDDGPSIPESHREAVFKPFYRLDPSRNKKTGGIGLGLSIAKDIIHQLGGRVLLEDSPRGGLRVVFQLPM